MAEVSNPTCLRETIDFVGLFDLLKKQLVELQDNTMKFVESPNEKNLNDVADAIDELTNGTANLFCLLEVIADDSIGNVPEKKRKTRKAKTLEVDVAAANASSDVSMGPPAPVVPLAPKARKPRAPRKSKSLSPTTNANEVAQVAQEAQGSQRQAVDLS